MLKFDDQFPIHRKVNGLTDAAFRLHVEAIFWCARNLTDGFIAQDDLASVSRYRRPEGYVAECVGRGAWDVVEGGWQIHDFLVWQQSRSKVLQVREARAKAGHNGGIRSGESRRAARSKPEAKPKQVGTQLLEPRAPRPPKGGLGGRAREAPAAARPAPSPETPHRFVEGKEGFCRCGQGRGAKIHPLGGKR